MLWAAAMGLVVFGVLQSAEWGWFLPSRGRPVDPRDVAGVLVVLGGLVSLRLFMLHVRRLDAAGKEPLVHPDVREQRR